MFRWLHQNSLKLAKVVLNSCWRLKKSIFWSTLISLVLWFIFHFRESLVSKICHLYGVGVSQLPFHFSSAAPHPSVKLNVTETLASANGNLTSVVEHVALMHAFPELFFGLQWAMSNLSSGMSLATHYPENRRDLRLEFRGYRSYSSDAYNAIKTLFSDIYDEVGLVLTFSHNTIEHLQQLRNTTSDNWKNRFTNFIWALDRQSPVIGRQIPLNFQQYLDRLRITLKLNIRQGNRLIGVFEEVLHHLDNIQAIADNDRDRYKAEHMSTRTPKLHRWIISIITNSEPSKDTRGPDEALAQFRPIIIQGSQRIEYILSKLHTIQSDIARLSNQMKQHDRWPRSHSSPQALAHDLRLGVKSLTRATEDWIQLLIDDHTFLQQNPVAKRELNPLTRKMEAEARNKRVQDGKEEGKMHR